MNVVATFIKVVQCKTEVMGVRQKGGIMETIFTLIQGVFVFGLIILGLVAIIAPIIAHIQYKLQTGQNLLNFWLTGLEAIALMSISAYIGNTSKPEFAETLGFLVIALIVIIVVSNKRAKKIGFQGGQKLMVIIAQLLSPISILIILTLFSGDSDKDKNNKMH